MVFGADEKRAHNATAEAIWATPWFWLYVLLSLVFWGVSLGFAHGEIALGESSAANFDWRGPAINAALLVPLARGADWARLLLMAEGLILAIGIGSGGVPPFEPVVGFLTLVAGLQTVLLWALGRWTRRRLPAGS